MPARIVRMYVNNYRCLVNFELRLGPETLLIGDNGTGKSSVFDALAAIQNLVLFGMAARGAFPAVTVTRPGDSLEQRLELDIEVEPGMLLRYVLVLVHGSMDVRIALEELTLNGQPAYRCAAGVARLYDFLTPSREQVSGYLVSSSFLASFEPTTAFAPIAWFKSFLRSCVVLRVEPAHIHADVSLAQAGDTLAVDASNFGLFYRQLARDLPARTEGVLATLQEIIPGFQTLRVACSEQPYRPDVLVATFQAPEGGSYDLDFDQLAAGHKVLVVLYTVLQALPVGAVLCLDSPDNFLAIREIQPFLVALDLCRDTTALQVLVASHSSEVIDYAGVGGALLLERPDGGPTHVRPVKSLGPLRLSDLMARGWLQEVA